MKETPKDDCINICQSLGNYCLTKLTEGNIGCKICVSKRLYEIEKEYIDIMGHDMPGVDGLTIQNEYKDQASCCTSVIKNSYMIKKTNCIISCH